MLDGLSSELLVVSFFALLTGFGIVRALLGSEQATRFDKEESREASPLEQGRSKESEWFEVLEVDPSADLESIKVAYKRKISQYHPDKVATLAPEFVSIAEQRTKEMNRAYEEALKVYASRASSKP